MSRSSRALYLVLAASVATLAACAPSDPESATPAADATAETAAASEATAETVTGPCADQPYVVREGAAQDAFSSTTNFLRCTKGSYALCYYSGADPLPCTLAEDGVGNCQCQVFEASDADPMYVEIGGILNQCVYDETVAQCSDDGSGCANLCIDQPGKPGCGDGPYPTDEAVVCDYVANGTFDPNADFISTFSFATVYVPGSETETFSLGSNNENGQYAGCMTASCTGSELDGHLYTECACPLWPADGGSADYQYGRACSDDVPSTDPGYCTTTDLQVWSAAVAELPKPAADATE